MPDRIPEADSEMRDELLLARAREGDERAFAAIVDRYEARVAATVIGMLGPGDEAEDVGQETFVRLFRSLERFRGDSSLGTYLTRIAMNLCLTTLRKRKRRRSRFVSVEEVPGGSENGRHPAQPGLEIVTADSEEGPLQRMEREEQRDRVHLALAQLNLEHQAVIVLRWMDGLSTREAAAVL
ncbi:MAG: RNA polymerase sigma factor, partial [Gemmatimonadota bacterium]